VHNTGKVPIAGFQLNAAPPNLFHVSSRSGWGLFGSGVCNGNQQGVLIYWSTGAALASGIQPGKSGQFGFTVNTTAPVAGHYALSYGPSAPQFGDVTVPAPSSLPTSGPCSK